MPQPYIDQQASGHEWLTEAASLYKELRMMRDQLQMEEQQALVANNSLKINTIRLALKKTPGKMPANTILKELDDISQGKRNCPAQATAAAIGELLADATKIGQHWLELLRTYKVPNLPASSTFNR